MKPRYSIRVEHKEDLIVLCAGFVREGVLFNVDKDTNGYWIIEFSGGY